MLGMLAGFKIVVDVVIYRLRKLEMANLAAAVAIALALRLSWIDVFARTAFAFALNIAVYLNNDYIDIDIDLKSADKDNAKARYLADHKKEALIAQWALVALMAAFALVYDPGLLIPLVLGGGICWWYSALLKHRPYLDILAMMLWGLAMPLCGVPPTSVLGWSLAILLGLYSAVFESIQVMRDADEDAEENVRTTGVVLGKVRTLLLARVGMVVASLYAAIVIHPVAAGITALTLVVPFAEGRIERYWTQVKMVCGIAWLFICVWVYFKGYTAGLVWSVDRAAQFG
jgi:4-hydroxybenzoate polyprenyltransferase